MSKKDILKVVVGIAAIFGLSSACSLESAYQTFGTCSDGREIDPFEITSQIANDLALQSLAANDPNLVIYHSGRELMQSNPFCCSFYLKKRLERKIVKLPFSGEAAAMLYYRKYKTGDKPYIVVHDDMYPCPSNSERSTYYETEKNHQLFVRNSK